MARRKGSLNSHASTIQEWVANNVDQSKELAAKLDKLLGVIQSYEGKADTTMELMLDVQKTFEKKIKALREENGEIKAQIEEKKNNSEKEKTPERFAEGEESQEKNRGENDQSKELMAKMDKLLGVIQSYKGKADTMMKLMLDM